MGTVPLPTANTDFKYTQDTVDTHGYPAVPLFEQRMGQLRIHNANPNVQGKW